MQLTSLVLLAGALGAAARPSAHAHAHAHRELHERAPAQHYRSGHQHPPPAAESKASSAAPAIPSAAPVPTPEAKSEPSAPAPAAQGVYTPFCSAGGASASSKNKRATYAQIMSVGELGMGNGCPWNSNIIEVAANVIDKYNYVQKYTNVAKEKYQVRCANKMGADSQLTGMFDVPAQKQLVFDLAPGETKYIAAMQNTQLACAFGPGTVEKTTHGQFAGNWVEADFGSAANNQWSGADCSSLVAQAYGMHVPGCRVCVPSSGQKCSTITEGGHGDNAYTAGMEAEDGVGLNLPPGPVVLEVEVGYSA